MMDSLYYIYICHNVYCLLYNITCLTVYVLPTVYVLSTVYVHKPTVYVLTIAQVRYPSPATVERTHCLLHDDN